MGIINVTPDSFYDGGKFFKDKLDKEKLKKNISRIAEEGADFIDIGGESTRPGSEAITIEEELERVIPAIEITKEITDKPISIDTYKSIIADEALKTGAEIVNDISGFRFDEKMPEVVSKYKASCILMHIKGTPKDMQDNPEYENVTAEVYEYLKHSAEIAEKNNIRQIVIDMGIGFGKKLEHNLNLLQNIGKFKELGYPILLGVSNKSFIDKLFPTDIDKRLSGTIAANVIGVMNGVNIIRVHNVLENKRALIITDALMKNYQ
jgi:dihydropteroate synthase